MKQKAQKTIFIDRQGGIVFTEFILCAIMLAIFSVALFSLPWAIGIVLFIAYALALDYLFFNVTIWRWIFSTVMSAGWGYFAFYITRHFIGVDINTYIVGIIAFIFMVWVHKDEYQFESSATVSIFDYYGRN